MIDASTLPLLSLATLNPPMNVVLVQDAEGLVKLKSFLDSTKGGIIGLDTETNVVKDFYFRKCRTIQVGDKNEQYVIDLLAFAGTEERLCESQGHFICDPIYKPIFDILAPALCSNKVLKVGQNLSFEYTVMWWNFGQRIWHLYSTDLAERVIQAGVISLKKMAEFSMAAIVARRFGVQVDKTEQGTFDLKSPLTQTQINYAAFDVRMPLSMREHQLREMTKDQLLSTAQIENDALGSYADMHLNGMRIDSERWMKRIDAVFERRKEELKTLDESFIPVVGRKDSQIDFWEMAQREYAWREHFEKATPEEMAKAEAVRYTRDAGQKAVLKAELEALTKARKAQKAEARRAFSELSKAYTDYKNKLPKMEGDAYINYGSNDQLLEALKKFKGMSTLVSVGDDHLLKYNDRPMVQVLRRYRKGKKDTGTYGKQWTMQWVTKACKEEGWRHPWDGRIHANFNQLEAETGRSSSSQPNMQNLTNDEEGEVHACFICDPPDEMTGEENCLVTTDMSGCELRIIAELAHAGSWIKAFALGQDVHSVSTEILEPIKWKEGVEPGCAYYELGTDGNPRKQKCECKEHKKLRKHTKAINFLLAYGGGPNALADELGISVDTAKELMRQHEKAFPEVWDYLRESGERAQRMNEARDLYGRRRLLPAPTWESAREYYIDEHSDRLELEEETCDQNIFNFKAAHLRDPDEEEKRKLTHRAPTDNEIKSAMRGLWGSIGRRGKNHAIQGSNASIIKRSMGCGFDKDNRPYLWHILPLYKARLLSMVHDELIIQCPRRFGKQVAEEVVSAFRRAAAEVMSQVEMTAEYCISDRWQKE
jgi:DNA polymerase I-like protein with 3'-5' exonuclease and polymerase domains